MVGDGFLGHFKAVATFGTFVTPNPVPLLRVWRRQRLDPDVSPSAAVCRRRTLRSMHRFTAPSAVSYPYSRDVLRPASGAEKDVFRVSFLSQWPGAERSDLLDRMVLEVEAVEREWIVRAIWDGRVMEFGAGDSAELLRTFEELAAHAAETADEDSWTYPREWGGYTSDP